MNNNRIINTSLGEGTLKIENGIISFSVKSSEEEKYSLYLKTESDIHYIGDLKRKNDCLTLKTKMFLDIDLNSAKVLILEKKTKAFKKPQEDFLDSLWKKHDIESCSNLSDLEKKVINNPIFIKMSKEKGGFYIKKESDESILYALEARFGTNEHPMLEVCDYAIWFPKTLKNKKIDAVGYWVVGIDKKKNEYFAIVD